MELPVLECSRAKYIDSDFYTDSTCETDNSLQRLLIVYHAILHYDWKINEECS